MSRRVCGAADVVSLGYSEAQRRAPGALRAALWQELAWYRPHLVEVREAADTAGG